MIITLLTAQMLNQKEYFSCTGLIVEYVSSAKTIKMQLQKY